MKSKPQGKGVDNKTCPTCGKKATNVLVNPTSKLYIHDDKSKGGPYGCAVGIPVNERV